MWSVGLSNSLGGFAPPFSSKKEDDIMIAIAIIVLATAAGIGAVLRIGTAFKRIEEMKEEISILQEKLKKDYWTKEVIKRSLMRGPIDPKHGTYEEWISFRTGENLYSPRDILMLNDMLFKHNCGRKEILADDLQNSKIRYFCQCGFSCTMTERSIMVGLSSLPEHSRLAIEKLTKTGAGRKKLGQWLSTGKLIQKEEMASVDDAISFMEPPPPPPESENSKCGSKCQCHE